MKTPSERFASTIRMEKPEPGDMIPVWELEFHGWDLFSPHSLAVGTGFTKLSSREKEKALHRNAEIFCSVSQELQFSAITVPGGYWEIATGHPAYFWLPGEARIQQLEILKNMLGDHIMLVAGNPSVIAMPGAEEYMDFAYTLMEDPKEIEKRAIEMCNKGIREAERLLGLGVGALYTPSDIADNHGPYFNPEQMDKLILPFLHKWADFVKSEGALAILHSDGNLESILEPIASTGVHAIQAIDSTAGMDLGRTMDAVRGKLALCGNIDCGLYTEGSPEQMYDATRKTLKLKEQGALILGASNAIEKELKKENYLAFLKAWKEFGAY